MHEERGAYMILPDILYYAKMEYNANGKKTPKYTIVKEWGYFTPMEKIKGKDGLVSMYLIESQGHGSNKANAPAMKLQAKNSINFTGLKEYFNEDGTLSCYSYGYPSKDATYGKDKKENPFFNYKDNGYLFIIHQDKTASTAAERIRPAYIELLVLDGAAPLIASYRKMLMMGGFDDKLECLRKQAKSVL